MGWGDLFGRLASDLVAGRGVNSTLRNARRTLGTETGKSVKSWVEKRKEVGDEAAFVLIRAMISVAAADGEIDGSERSRILDKGKDAGLSDAEMKKIEAEMLTPASPEQLAAELKGNDPKLVYQISLAAIDLDDPAEHAHLRRLAKALSLSATSVGEIHEELGAPPLT